MKNILLFIICICISGAISLMFGQDVSTDLLNYHLYIPYAFLHDRWSVDFLPAGVAHTFFNPLADIPFFWLFYYLNDWPKLTAFLKGGYYGMLLFLLCKWVPMILKGTSWPAKILHIMLVAFSLTGMAALLQVGFSSNEELMTCFAVLGAYLLFLGTDEHLHFCIKYMSAAAFVVSLAAGLKYTATPAACGIGLCCLLLLIHNKSAFKNYLYVIGSAIIGFLLTNGYFLWKNWINFKNPLFPFFNHIFKSPFFLDMSLPNSHLTPNTWQEYLFLPLLRINFIHFGEYRLDFRLLLGIISFVILGINWLVFRKRKHLAKNYFLLLSLFIGTYIPWLIVFGNMRYSIFLEILASLLFTLLLIRYIPPKPTAIILTVLTGLSVTIISVCSRVEPFFYRQHQTFDKKNIVFTQNVVIPDDALVILTGHYSALIPFLNPKARYMGGIQLAAEKLHASHGDILSVQPLLPAEYYQHNFPIRQEIQQHPGSIYLLVPFLYWVWEESFWKEYGLDTKEHYCQVFDTNLTHQKFRMALCRVKKV